jgi:hypothetical protein
MRLSVLSRTSEGRQIWESALAWMKRVTRILSMFSLTEDSDLDDVLDALGVEFNSEKL